MDCISNFLDHMQDFGRYFDPQEKKSITLFNKMEYTPVLGNVIGAAEVVYGISKIALETIRGIGNCFLKHSEYHFKKELASGIGILGRGFALLLPFAGLVAIYPDDLGCVRRYNYNNALALINAGSESDLDIAQEYAKKLPYMNNDELYMREGSDPDYGDLSYTYRWACKRKTIMRCIANTYTLLGITNKAKEILDVIDKVEPKTLERIEQSEKQRLESMEYWQEEAKRAAEKAEAEKSRRQQEQAERVAYLRALHN